MFKMPTHDLLQSQRTATVPGWTGCCRPLPYHPLVSLLPSRNSLCFAPAFFLYFPLPFNFPQSPYSFFPFSRPSHSSQFIKSWRADGLIPVLTDFIPQLPSVSMYRGNFRWSRVRILLAMRYFSHIRL